MILCLLSFCLLTLPSRSKVLHLPRGHLSHQPKGDARPPDLHLSSPWISRQLKLLRTSTWYMTQRLSWSGLEPTSPVHWAETLTTRPPSSWLQCSFLLHMDFYIRFLKLTIFAVFSVSGKRYQPFSSSLYALSLVSQSDSSRQESPSCWPFRFQWLHSRLFQIFFWNTWGLSRYSVSP